MRNVGLLLSLPTESIAVRVLLATLVALLLARVFRRVIVTRQARVSLPLAPSVAIFAVVVLYAASPDLPAVWHTIDASGGLTVPVRNTYLTFTPGAASYVLSAWALVAGMKVGARMLRHRRAVTALRARASDGTDAPARVTAIVEEYAGRLGMKSPPVTVVSALSGGGAIVGLRAPVLLLDRELISRLDDEELAGVVGHELAHVRRHDNLLALGLCLFRDLMFFVPGGRWSVETLLREREHAADEVAADLTGRPAALAGGLLKVLEFGRADVDAACSSLLSEGTLVARVENLLDERPPPPLGRHVSEYIAVLVATGTAVAVAAALPGVLAGPGQERAALGVLLSDVRSVDAAPTGRPVVFTAFDGGRVGVTTSRLAAGEPSLPRGDDEVLDVGDVDSAGSVGFAACARSYTPCEPERVRVPLTPRPIVRVSGDQMEQWRLETILRSDNQESALFWFSRLSAR